MFAVSASSLAVPAVLTLIALLGYSSQSLYPHLEPHPLEKRQAIEFNVLLACLLISFVRACLTDPGRVPEDWVPAPVRVHGEGRPAKAKGEDGPPPRPRWCSRCGSPKPPRAHHCKTCQRCIPRMDHHCPWLANCVSHTTFPHFMRVIIYASLALAYNEYLLYVCCAEIWRKRHLPSYLGPSAAQLFHLFILLGVNSATLFGVGLMALRFSYMFAQNVTSIESWEIERHQALLKRARCLGGTLPSPEGTQIRVRKQEFPYDIGIFANMSQAMNTKNPLVWLWPFAATPPNEKGLDYEVNGFEDPSLTWPPPDPDRMPRPKRQFHPESAFTHRVPSLDDHEAMVDFRRRQEEDSKRWRSGGLKRRRPFHERVDRSTATRGNGEEEEDYSSGGESGEEAWKNSEGERLKDFGVDEEAEFYDEDELPLGELMRRRKEATLAAGARGG